MRSRPFRLIGIHRQQDTDEAIVDLCKTSGVEYPIFAGGSYSKESFSGLPFSVVFDHTGKQVYKGHPGQAEPAVEKALLGAPSLYLGESKFDKLKAVAAQIEKKTALGSAASGLRKKTDSTDEAEKAEAKALLDVLEGYAHARLEEAQALREEDPDQSLNNLRALAKEFAGDSLGSEVSA